MRDTIRNDQLEVSVKRFGAELCSIKSADGTEYMWQADPAVWARHAPILFPVVGALRDNGYYYNTKAYKLGRHGFARDMEFNLSGKSETSLKYKLRCTEETLGVYPFRFSLRVIFKLDGPSVKVTYEVVNRSRRVMPFSIGGHPAFGLNWHGNGTDRVEDYYVEFDKPETLTATRLDRNGLLTDRQDVIIENSPVLQLTEDIFNEDALVFLDIKSERAVLKSHKNDRQLSVAFSGFPHLGIWAKPGAGFVCIEPWCGHADPDDTDRRIIVKHGIVHLESNQSFRCSHTIGVA